MGEPEQPGATSHEETRKPTRRRNFVVLLVTACTIVDKKRPPTFERYILLPTGSGASFGTTFRDIASSIRFTH